ncbi:GDSL-like Lipase/Acylhydrolase [Alistipes timonensis JC136]|uniref:GDSL-like Lipase/Acylhydrolase n=1 Tax=Alistipes timonensis JC136 TaxID=1033731 RepID=A0A1H3XMX0_9BACT|nr:SGNH/GDSL hydrolase family protein [Alistipes timonensis]SEA00787.1 GDSL-like Lipase/Acylhydrolase [Alistipes timonensis JC136]
MRKTIASLLIVSIAALLVDYLSDRVMLHGVNAFYGLDQHSKILLVGHSHLMLATDKERMEKELNTTVSKYTREGVNVYDRKVMVHQYLSSAYSDSLKICLYGVDLCTFTGKELSQNSYMLFYPFMDNAVIDDYIKGCSPATDYWLHKLLRVSRYNDDGIKGAAARGWRKDWSNRKNGVVDIPTYKKKLLNGDERHIEVEPELIAEFTKTIKMLTDRGVKVVLVNTPTLDLLNEYEPKKYEMVVDWFTQFASNHENVEYWDFNPEYSSRHELFHDRLHLNAKGQQVITTEIIDKLQSEL